MPNGNLHFLQNIENEAFVILGVMKNQENKKLGLAIGGIAPLPLKSKQFLKNSLVFPKKMGKNTTCVNSMAFPLKSYGQTRRQHYLSWLSLSLVYSSSALKCGIKPTKVEQLSPKYKKKENHL